MAAADHQTTQAYVAALAPEGRSALYHLLACPRCRHAAEVELVEQLRDLLKPPAPDARRDRLSDGEIAAIQARVEEATREARGLATLTAQAREQAIAADPRLRDPLIAASLLVQADDALDQPERAEQLGAAAFAILSTQDSDLGGRNIAMLLRALWTVLRSRRVQGRLEEADEILRDAIAFLGAAPAASEERALLLSGVGQLRWAERRLDEAAALFARAAQLFGDFGERQGEAACRAQAAFVLLEIADLPRALNELTLAHLHIDAELAPALAARTALALSWTSLAMGQVEPARQRLATARRLYDRAPAAGDALLHGWWEARIAALDGDAADADSKLDAVRRALLTAGSVPEAARCTLDLLELRVESQRLDALSHLAPDLLNESGCRLSALQPAQLIDWLATLAEQRSQRFPPALTAVRHYLAGLRPPPRDYIVGQPPFSQDRPNLITDVTELADALLLAARGAGAPSA